MPVNAINAINALKDNYLEAFRNQAASTISPFLNEIEERTVGGKEIVTAAPIGLNGGFGFGAEGSPMPSAGGQRYDVFKETVKDMYVPIQISDKAIRASKNSKTAFVDLFGKEVEGGFETAKWNVGRALFGDGTGVLTTISALAEAGNTVTVADHKFCVIGLTVDFYETGDEVGDTPAVAARRITDVTRNADGSGTVTFDGTATTLAAGFITVQNSYGRELTGLKAIFDDSITTLYGLTKASYKYLNPISADLSGDITDSGIIDALFESDEYKNGKVNMILMGKDTYKAYAEYLKTMKVTPDTIDLKGGFRAITFQHANRIIRVLYDKWVPNDEAYGIATGDFKMYSFGDWDYMDLEGAPKMQRVAGQNYYEMSLAKYGNIICENPGSCIRLYNCV